MKFKFIEYRVDGVSSEGLPTYAGIYTVTPKANEDQVLNTAQTILENNITVKAIPFSKAINPSAGHTVTIG